MTPPKAPPGSVRAPRRRTRPGRWLAPVLGGLALSTAPGAAPTLPTDLDEASERVMLRQVDQAQQRLAGDLELWQKPVAWAQAREHAGLNYTVRTTRSSLYARRIDETLDGNLDRFAELMEIDPTPVDPVRFLLTADPATYNGLADANGGNDVSSRYGGWYCQQLEVILGIYEPEGWPLLYGIHGATQELLHRCELKSGPEWIQHALPSFMEVQPDRYYHPFATGELAKLLGQRWTPLDELFRSPGSWGRDQLRQAGMLLEYLAHHHPETRPQDSGAWPFADYLRKALRDQPIEGNRTTALLGPERQDLENSFRTYAWPETR